MHGIICHIGRVRTGTMSSLAFSASRLASRSATAARRKLPVAAAATSATSCAGAGTFMSSTNSNTQQIQHHHQTRSLSDFSFAGPRKLDEIMKLDMIKEKKFKSQDVQDLWLGYHETKEHMDGTVIDGKTAKSVLSRAALCPFFIQPIFREDGYFTLVSQFQSPSHFLLAYLEDYKMDPARAQPLITFSVFDDLADEFDIGLVRVDVINKGIEDDEGLRCVNSLLDAYGKDELFTNIHAFNKKPESFDFDDYIAQQNQKWKEDQNGDGKNADE